MHSRQLILVQTIFHTVQYLTSCGSHLCILVNFSTLIKLFSTLYSLSPAVHSRFHNHVLAEQTASYCSAEYSTVHQQFLKDPFSACSRPLAATQHLRLATATPAPAGQVLSSAVPSERSSSPAPAGGSRQLLLRDRDSSSIPDGISTTAPPQQLTCNISIFKALPVIRVWKYRCCNIQNRGSQYLELLSIQRQTR